MVSITSMRPGQPLQSTSIIPYVASKDLEDYFFLKIRLYLASF